MVMIVFTLDFHKLLLKSGKIQNAIAFLSLTVFVRNRYFLLTAVSKYMKHEATLYCMWNKFVKVANINVKRSEERN